MPKISELPVTTTLSGIEKIAAVQSGITRSITPLQLGIYAYNVKNYGAVGNGATNDTVAIQAAMDAAGVAGGGVVFFPPGDYIVQPAAVVYNTQALLIKYSNIHIKGASQYVSKLTFRLWDGDDPATNYDLESVSGRVQRGHMFRILDDLETITTVRFSDLEIDGSAGYQVATHNAPANPATGDGWDITHKGIWANGDHIDEWIIDDCYIHSFRGELVYYGGGSLDTIIVRNCKFRDCNADLLSTSADTCIVESNEFAFSYQAIENSFNDGMNIYRNNYIHDIDHGGMHVYPSTHSNIGYAEIYNNQFVRVDANAILCPGGRNTRIHGNLFVECLGYNINLESPGYGGSASDPMALHNMEIFNNTFTKDENQAGEPGGIRMNQDATGTYPGRFLSVHDNTSVVSKTAFDAGWDLGPVVSLNGQPTNLGPGNRWERNHILGGIGGDDTSFSTKPYSTTLLTGGEQVFAKLWHDQSDQRPFRVYLTYYVLANATIRFRCTYTKPGASGTLVSEDILASTAKVTDDKGNFMFERLASYDPSGRVTVYYTCDTADAVRAHVDITML